MKRPWGNPAERVLESPGYRVEIDEEDALRLDIAGYIMKPIVRTDLARVIRNVLDRK